jgi:hypothetical protein
VTLVFAGFFRIKDPNIRNNTTTSFRSRFLEHCIFAISTIHLQIFKMTTSTTTEAVVNHYSAIARDRGEQDIPYATRVAQAFGYSLADLTAIPDGANMGLSCGNPLAMASLKPV